MPFFLTCLPPMAMACRLAIEGRGSRWTKGAEELPIVDVACVVTIGQTRRTLAS